MPIGRCIIDSKLPPVAFSIIADVKTIDLNQMRIARCIDTPISSIHFDLFVDSIFLPRMYARQIVNNSTTMALGSPQE